MRNNLISEWNDSMSFEVHDLTVNYLKEPIGLDSLPHFSWKLSSDRRGTSQTAYRIMVSTSCGCLEHNNCDFWDSGWVNSSDSIHIEYKGLDLPPLTYYYWGVICRDNLSEECVASSFFVTGKRGTRWEANWITAGFIQNEQTAYAAPYLRKRFQIDKPVSRAILVVCGLGFFEAYINGNKAGDDMLSPAYTRYDITDLYLTYDVSGLLGQGENVIGIVLGNGMYNCFSQDMWNTPQAPWRHWPKVIAELHVTYSDGTGSFLGTRKDWKSSSGPITFNSLRHGEHYDARLENPGWNDRGFNDALWENAKIIRAPGGILTAMEMEPVRVQHVFTAVNKWYTPKGWVFDMGQNQAGIGSFVFHGPEGTKITIRYSDLLTNDKELDQEPIKSFVHNFSFQTDQYTKKSDGDEYWNPVFVYHGFQYIEINGIDYEPELSDVKSLVIYNAFESRGGFSCSDSVLNKVQHMCLWSTMSNAIGVFQSDPHREKNSWTGDGSASSEQFLINFGAQPFLKKWLRDIRESQRPSGSIPCIVPSTGWGYNAMNGPDWSSALTDIPWNIYLYNADKQVLAANYESIKRHCDYMESMSDHYLVHYGLGDWCAPFEGPAISVNMASFKCPTEVTDTAYFYSAASRIVQMARILNHTEDIGRYLTLAANIRQAFRTQFYDKSTMTVKGNCQTATATMLYYDLADPDEVDGLFQKLLEQISANEDHLDFGILGLKSVMHTLGARGRGDVGIRMILQKTFPSCQRWAELKANTLWECWNGGGSHNHHMFSDLSAFMYKYVGGIAPDPAEPGFRHILFRPAVSGGQEYAKCMIESMYGTIRCDWSNINFKVFINLEVPVGTYATLFLPEEYLGKLTEHGKPVRELDGVRIAKGDRESGLILASGDYNFIA
jgi:alpha-L-rhamnosidase